MASDAASTPLQTLKRRIRTRLLLLGTLRRASPINPAFGLGKGTPIDRYYIERFLSDNRELVRGRVMEIGDREYTDRFGTGVSSSDVLHFEAGSPVATIVGDLADCPQIADESFDCMILTQTLHYLRDMVAGVHAIHRMLAPGGSALLTVPGISQVSRYDMEHWGDRYRLTTLAARELFEPVFGEDNVTVEAFGNTLSAICLLEGVTAEDLRARDLDARDLDYEVVITVRATRPTS